MADQTWGRNHVGATKPPADLYVEVSAPDVTPITLFSFTMPPDSYAWVDVKMMARSADGADLGFAWSTARYVRTGSGTPGSGVVLDVQTAVSTAGALSFTADSSGNVFAKFTAGVLPGARGAVRVSARGEVLVVK